MRRLLTVVVAAGLLQPLFAAEPPACKSLGITAPVPSNSHAPENYPPVSEALGEQGTTTVRFTVTEEGTATAATIETSSGSMRLDDASIEEIQTRWRYRPARTSDNKPVACVYKAEVRWILHDNAHVLPPELQRMVLRMAPADYPAGARARREQGVVFLLVQYDGSGKKVSVISSSGFAELDRAAERIITEKLVIAPGMFNGQAIMTTAFVPVQWILDDAAVAPKKSD